MATYCLPLQLFVAMIRAFPLLYQESCLPTKKKTDSGVPIEALSIYMTHTILLLAIIVQEMHSVINTSQHSLARAFKTDL